MEFKIGDIVEFGGVNGVVVNIIDSDRASFPLCVNFVPNCNALFTLDGRYHIKHTKPLLNLVSRPKKKVKKQMKAWVNVYPNSISGIYALKHQADDKAAIDRIACVELTGEYEVEE